MLESVRLQTHHVLIISMLVFIVLNLIENYFHYTIGYNAKEEQVVFPKPSPNDWVKIIILMTIFGYLQGWFTEFFSQYY
jgi:hypothetical protein